ncbi:hypothetical protein CCMA1212_006347 [Trichoderma ghanense]|uniref:Glucose-methanol-choline oxidoreductase N-terminal domain-containing protein n=1 Tax=Trichoderma ghanense TaxID=65468 RepID=A0ABY2H4C1_9HYPO
MTSYDYIIVGGGTAGLVLAARLTEDSSKRVLVLEAGEDLTGDARLSVPAMWPTLLNTDADWKFKTVPQTNTPASSWDLLLTEGLTQPGLNDRSIAFPQGKVLGGSSAINGLSFTSSSKANVDAWSRLGNPGWDWASFSQSLARSYTLTSPSADVTGSGPLQLSYPKDADNAWPGIWQQTLEGLGFPKSEDTAKQACGPVFVPDTIHPASKTRSYAGNAYLEPARSRENLTVIPKAAVSRILFDKDGDAVTATGVEYTKDDDKTQTAAGKEIILTAGTINSPRLLELSGVGDAKRLEKLGIDVVVDNPNVGENLQNHPLCGLSFEARDDEKTMDGLARQDPAALQAAMAAYSQQLGPFASSGTNNAAQLPFPGIQTAEGKAEVEHLISKYIASADAGANAAFVEAQADFVRSILTSPDEASGYYISFPGYAAFNPDGTMAPPPAGTGKHFSIALLLAHPLSRGSVHITSATDVAIDPRYLSHPLDIEILARHLGFVESIAGAQPLASHLKAVEQRNAAVDQAKEYLRRTAVGAHHFTGTCSMMPEALGGVVDARLRVYGVSNLRVADASIIPLTPRANPQATVYGVAEHAAAIIKGEI